MFLYSHPIGQNLVTWLVSREAGKCSFLNLQESCAAAAAAKSLQLCPTLCDPIDGSPPGSSGPGILQARTFGVGCHVLLQCMKVKSESEVAQSCPTLSDPMVCSLSGSSTHGIFPGKSTGVGRHCLLHQESCTLLKIWECMFKENGGG